MTHQQMLHEVRSAHEFAVAEDTKPGASIGFDRGIVGVTVRDNAGRIAMCTLDLAAIDELLDELLLARAHLANGGK